MILVGDFTRRGKSGIHRCPRESPYELRGHSGDIIRHLGNSLFAERGRGDSGHVSSARWS